MDGDRHLQDLNHMGPQGETVAVSQGRSLFQSSISSHLGMQRGSTFRQPRASLGRIETGLPALQLPVPRPSKFTGTVSMEEIRSLMEAFYSSRQIAHTPRYLLLDVVKHTGALSEAFQQRGAGDSALDIQVLHGEERRRIAEAIADCYLSISRLADICNVDLSAAILERVRKLERKHPIDREKRDRSSREEEAGKRKRFTDDEIGALTSFAERYGWSLFNVSNRTREAFCRENGISRERLSNFFNNRRPRDFRKGAQAMSASMICQARSSSAGSGPSPGDTEPSHVAGHHDFCS
uniref:Homeobox domain-containing protein n=1 Tax=Tetraselmis sp. GSL018 TaxID=582737 RepID=A0A061SA13_9CHLO|mmetsp:Transcript_11468/g.27241  ORF Transcript_11468/g.27241 Transcript_11468/m.27241 type:complete len:294 (-) Transcript_11468:280-1161(-)